MLPDSLKLTVDQYFEQYKEDVLSISNGRLFDFSGSSVLTVLGESQALAIDRLITSEIDLIDEIASRVVENLGFIRIKGTKAVATARYQLANVYDRDFIIPRGNRFLVGSVVFQTINDLIIPAFTDTKDPANYQYARVDAIALDIGSIGNSQGGQVGILQQMLELDSIWLDSGSVGGTDEESTSDFFNRVSLLISKVLENQISLISVTDFKLAVAQLIGSDAIAIPIPEISRDGANKELVSMNLFIANADGSPISTAQKNQLSANIQPRSPLVQGRLYFSDLSVPLLNISVSIKVPIGKEFNDIANDINTRLRDRFSIAETGLMDSLELYEAIYQVKLTGALLPIVTWAYGTDQKAARNIPLPKIAIASDQTSPVKIDQIIVIQEPIGLQKIFTS